MRIAQTLLLLVACSENERGAANIELEVLRDAALLLDQLEIEVWNDDARVLDGRAPDVPRMLATRELVRLTIADVPRKARARVEVAGLLEDETVAQASTDVTLVPGEVVTASVTLTSPPSDGGPDGADGCVLVCGFCMEEVGDSDDDGVGDCFDNCLLDANPDQRDTDNDGFGNRCDVDVNDDGATDAADIEAISACFSAYCTDKPCECIRDEVLICSCHHDLDGDGRVNSSDTLLATAHAGWPQLPASCDPDEDCVLGCKDNCTLHANSDQRDTDGDGLGNRCDTDVNLDGFQDLADVDSILACFGADCTDEPCECVDGTATCSCHHDLDGNGLVDFTDSLIAGEFIDRRSGPGSCL